MKPAIFVFLLLVGVTACSKKEKQTQLLSNDEYRKLAQPGPAAGRAEYVSPVELLPDPAKYSGKRVILEGIWSSGFEQSNLDLENAAQDFWIWVDVDWAKVDSPIGDFSHRKDREDGAKPDQNGRVSYHILAEGTFYYRKPHLIDGPSGFGHLSGSPGCFLIDRLFRFDAVNEEPKGRQTK